MFFRRGFVSIFGGFNTRAHNAKQFGEMCKYYIEDIMSIPRAIVKGSNQANKNNWKG